MNHRVLILAAVGVLWSSWAWADDKEQCLTASSAAQDARAQGKLMAAREQLIACARDACPAVVRRDCAQWLGEVESSMPTVVITARDASGHDVVAVKVTVDGAPRLTALDGKAIAIDPGPHTFSFAQEGAAPIEQKVVIREGEKNRAITVELSVAGASPTPTTSPTTTPPPPSAPPPSPDVTPQGGRSPLPVVGLIAAGVGVVGLGLGGVLGGVAASKWSDAQAQCPASKGCLPGSAAYQLRDDASSMATISTVMFIAGGAALAAGVTLFLVAPKRSDAASATLVPLPGGLALRGSY